jgi:hypothetical protein
MIVFLPFRQLVFPPAGALALLLALFVIAPPELRGGCSHLVTSQSERTRQSSLIDAFVVDDSGGEPARSEPPSVPALPRPCSGAWCPTQPDAPAAPSGTSDVRLETWAWYEVLPGSTSADSSSFSADEIDLRPRRPLGSVFRPPRLVLSA